MALRLSEGLGIILVRFDSSADNPAGFDDEGNPLALGLVRMDKLKVQMLGEYVSKFGEGGERASCE